MNRSKRLFICFKIIKFCVCIAKDQISCTLPAGLSTGNCCSFPKKKSVHNWTIQNCTFWFNLSTLVPLPFTDQVFCLTAYEVPVGWEGRFLTKLPSLLTPAAFLASLATTPPFYKSLILTCVLMHPTFIEPPGMLVFSVDLFVCSCDSLYKNL